MKRGGDRCAAAPGRARSAPPTACGRSSSWLGLSSTTRTTPNGRPPAPAGKPHRLHVDGDRAARVQLRAPLAERQLRDAHDVPDADLQPQPRQARPTSACGEVAAHGASGCVLVGRRVDLARRRSLPRATEDSSSPPQKPSTSSGLARRDRRARRGSQRAPAPGPCRSCGRAPRARPRRSAPPRRAAARRRHSLIRRPPARPARRQAPATRSRRRLAGPADPQLVQRHRRGAPSAQHRALERRRPARVGPAAGQRESRQRGARARAQRRRAGDGAERRGVLARDLEALDGAPSRARGSSCVDRRQVALAQRVARSSCISPSAPDSDTARYWQPAGAPAAALRSNRYCTGVLTPAANGSSSTRRS